MLTVTEFRARYPNSTEEQVALYAAAVAAELANPPQPEPDLPMPVITATEVTRGPRPLPETGKGPSAEVIRGSTSPSQMTPPGRGAIRYWNPADGKTYPPVAPAPDSRAVNSAITGDIRRIVLGRRLTPAERAAAERPDMSGDDLLALLAGVPNAREWEALEGD